MSRKAKSPDNARAEGFFGTLKQEFFYARDWKGTTRGASCELDEYIVWYRDEKSEIARMEDDSGLVALASRVESETSVPLGTLLAQHVTRRRSSRGGRSRWTRNHDPATKRMGHDVAKIPRRGKNESVW